MINSMTGYAGQQGEGFGYRWTWELRSVNGRGLDIRMRLPDWIEGLEPALRPILTKALSRGNVALNLRVQREESDGILSLNETQLDQVLAAMTRIEVRAMEEGLSLAPSTAAEIVALRGVMDQSGSETDTSALKGALQAQFEDLLSEFCAMRGSEGNALNKVLSAQLDDIQEITEEAAGILAQRREDAATNLRRNLAAVMDAVGDADEDRVAQELAMLAVKADVTEEIDRLRAHVAAARELLDSEGPAGRKLDFLMQEFNREANTLCSKAQMKALTDKGLALKVLIDQMREQVQNVE